MAEAKSSAEIEDILSSIRRLVSEDLRPAPRAEIVSRMVVAEKLILTPALRVVRPAPQPVETAPAAPEVGAKKPVTARLHLEAAPAKAPDLVATLTQGVDQQALDWDSETGDPAPDIASLDWSSFTFARRPPQETWAPQPRAAEAAAPAWAQPDPGESIAPVAEAPIAEDVPGWADEAEAKALADLDAPEAEEIPDSAQEDDNIFSEQVLRELVRDLIREQLQGDLGERITRNIRKLVKAEIARSLDLRALD